MSVDDRTGVVMGGRAVRVAAWATASATVVLAVATATIIAAGSASIGVGPGSVLFPVPFAAMAVVGALVASRQPRNATGWLFLATAFVMTSNAFAQAYVSSSHGPYLPASHLLAWVAAWTWAAATVLVGVVLMVFPSGRAPSARWQWFVRAAYLFIGLLAVSALFTFPASTRGLIAMVSSEYGPSPPVPGSGLLITLLLGVQVFLPLGFVVLVVRFVRSRGIERQQMKWFVYGTSFVALSIAINVFLILALDVANPIDNPVAAGTVLLGLTAIPVTAGIGILRYRLYDIDRLISRTVSYGVVTALLAGTFALVVLLPTAIVGSSGSSPGWVIALATLTVAALFGPLRRRVQAAVDRRFNRARFDAQVVVDAFVGRMRDGIDVDALKAELAHVVTRTMQPSSISLWVRR